MKTAAVAKERLQLIIAHERDGASAVNFLPQLQRELIEVISKYVKVNPDDMGNLVCTPGINSFGCRRPPTHSCPAPAGLSRAPQVINVALVASLLISIHATAFIEVSTEEWDFVDMRACAGECAAGGD